MASSSAVERVPLAPDVLSERLGATAKGTHCFANCKHSRHPGIESDIAITHAAAKTAQTLPGS
jgi:hypothetical protein